jgi:hypothetical protein
MKISRETIAILKHLSSINQNVILKPGKVVSTISPQKNVLADIVIAEDFEAVMPIYDLSEFLGALSLFSDPEVTFKGKYALISENGNAIKYYAADESILIVPNKAIKFPTSDIDFTLSQETLALVLRTAGVLRSSDVSLVADGKFLSFEVADLKSATSNSFTVPLGDTDKTFKVNFKTENLKLIPGEYDVSISAKKISRFKNTSLDAVFYIALESTSSFD